MSASQSITIHRTYQIRGYTSRTGLTRIREVLGICQRLYNQALEKRITVYRETDKSVSKFDQFKWLTVLRSEFQQLRDIDLQIERGALVRLDRAFESFFRRVKAGDGDGFPRFKPWQRYTCIELSQVQPRMVKGDRVKIKGLPLIRIKPERPLPNSAQLKSLRIGLHRRILSIDLVYEEDVQTLPANGRSSVGIDLGVNRRMTLSTGETVERRRMGIAHQRRLQRSIARKKKGGKNRQKAVARLANFKRREVIRNRNVCHRITTDLVRRFGTIVIENLQIGNMIRKGGSYKSGLNREIHGQTWGLLRSQLAYKAEWAGRQLIEVNPAYTSRTCSVCGEVNPKPKVYQLFECSKCGHTEDRDVNAAKNILHRGWDFRPAGRNVEVVNSCVP